MNYNATGRPIKKTEELIKRVLHLRQEDINTEEYKLNNKYKKDYKPKHRSMRFIANICDVSVGLVHQILKSSKTP